MKYNNSILLCFLVLFLACTTAAIVIRFPLFWFLMPDWLGTVLHHIFHAIPTTLGTQFTIQFNLQGSTNMTLGTHLLASWLIANSFRLAQRERRLVAMVWGWRKNNSFIEVFSTRLDQAFFDMLKRYGLARRQPPGIAPP